MSLSIVVAGMIAGTPGHGGAAWAVLQYVEGLRRLGHDVLLLEEVEPPIAYGVRDYFDAVVRCFDLRGQATIVTRCLPLDDIGQRARGADVVLNLSGVLTDPRIMEAVPTRVYLDLDPGFAQVWAAEGIDLHFDLHTQFATVGLGLGRGSRAPTVGLDWIHTVPPVVLARWPVGAAIEHDALTTVGNWRSYGSVEHDGVFYGQKAHSLRALGDLPRRTSVRLLLALAIDPQEHADLARLAANGWYVTDPRDHTCMPEQYARFVRGSKGEFSVAKQGYVLSASGWFSDRSVCYLASGRPVIAQDTGWSNYLPSGEGLLAFVSAEDALAAIEDVHRNYERHQRAARHVAERHFDSDLVLARLLDHLR